MKAHGWKCTILSNEKNAKGNPGNEKLARKIIWLLVSAREIGQVKKKGQLEKGNWTSQMHLVPLGPIFFPSIKLQTKIDKDLILVHFFSDLRPCRAYKVLRIFDIPTCIIRNVLNKLAWTWPGTGI